MCLEDNLITYYKQFIYFLSLSFPVVRSTFINRLKVIGRDLGRGWQTHCSLEDWGCRLVVNAGFAWGKYSFDHCWNGWKINKCGSLQKLLLGEHYFIIAREQRHFGFQNRMTAFLFSLPYICLIWGQVCLNTLMKSGIPTCPCHLCRSSAVANML